MDHETSVTVEETSQQRCIERAMRDSYRAKPLLTTEFSWSTNRWDWMPRQGDPQ